jgi:hypothetical protein
MKQFFVMCIVCALGVLPSVEGFAQKYNPEKFGFTKPAQTRWEWINLVVATGPQDQRSLVKDEYRLSSMSFKDSIAGEISVSNIGDAILLWMCDIYYRGYRGDVGFENFLLRDVMWNIKESRNILENSREVVITQSLVRQNPNVFVWVYDGYVNNKGEYIGHQKIKLDDLLGQKVLVYKGKIILLLANGAPVGMNDPLFDKDNPSRAGYQDVQPGKMMSGQSREIHYVPRQPKAPDLFVPEDAYWQPPIPTGERGQDGKDGKDGRDGAPGPQGQMGPRGERGAPGPQGIQGVRGPQGTPGPAGKDGAPGRDGAVGPQGPVGPKGETGSPGRDGRDGIQGPRGERGEIGPRGPQGPTGFIDPAKEAFIFETLKNHSRIIDKFENSPREDWEVQIYDTYYVVLLNGKIVEVIPRGSR